METSAVHIVLRKRIFWSVLVSGLLTCTHGFAQTTIEWLGTASGDTENLENAANWSPAQLPTINDTVLFSSSGNSTIDPVSP
ncbi:MAG: hypothetical protein ACO398_10305, partial [Kiritimatiellia bacterium]